MTQTTPGAEGDNVAMGFQTSRLIEKAALSIAVPVLGSILLLAPASDAQTSPPSSSGQTVLASSHDRWLHVRVTNPDRNEESAIVFGDADVRLFILHGDELAVLGCAYGVK